MYYGYCVTYFVDAHEVFLFSGYYIVFCAAGFFWFYVAVKDSSSFYLQSGRGAFKVYMLMGSK